MCGFYGHISNSEISEGKLKVLENSLDTLQRRGPDGRGVYCEGNTFLGHRRLSIIDLSENGAQPFYSKNNKAVIIFNGEIYNYKEISQDLALRTTSDTEVLIEGYLKDGIEFFKKIRGIYAFAILDKREGNNHKLICLRDPAGVKPFYFEKTDTTFSFASELKAIAYGKTELPAIDEEALKAYIHLGYIVEPKTIYKNIKALQPGILFSYNINDGKVSETRLHDYSFDDFNSQNFNQNATKTEELLREAAKRNMVADVDVNVALSGGIDSSLIFAYCNEINSTTGITVAFDENEYDESSTAKEFAQTLNANHKIVKTSVSNSLTLLNDLLNYYDQPYADSSFIPFYFLSEAAAKHSKVLIGGDSGDEIHNGYSGHRNLPKIVKLAKRGGGLFKIAAAMLKPFKLPKLRAIKKALSILSLTKRDKVIFEWNVWQPTLKHLYSKNPFKYDTSSLFKIFSIGNNTAKSDLGFIQENYFRYRMQSDYLRKSDMMSMYNSLEFRVPMLDEDLVSYSLEIPYQQKAGESGQKKILRFLHKKIFPPKTSELKKKGFTIPLDEWLGKENLKHIVQYLKRGDGIVLNYVHEFYINQLEEAVLESKHREYFSRASAYQRILIFYSLQYWYLEVYSKLKSNN